MAEVEDVYVRLRRFLDTLPAGFPETPDGVELKLLKKMFTPGQAELTLNLRAEPESAREIAGRLGIDAAVLAERLEELAVRGLIFRIHRDGERLYQAYHFAIGLYEFQVNRLDEELCRLIEAYLPYLGMAGARYTRQYRVIPVESAVQEHNEVAPYNRVRELVRSETLISCSPCICKKERALLGHPCDKPREVCLMFGDFARFYIDNGYGRAVGVEEALRVLDRAEESGLILTCSNSRKLETLCCCCTCCCPTLKGIKYLRSPAKFMLSYYTARIDAALCTGCGTCREVYPMTAVERAGEVFQVIEKRCLGCGLCVNRCPSGAMALVERPNVPEAPPPTVPDVLDRIARERGVR